MNTRARDVVGRLTVAVSLAVVAGFSCACAGPSAAVEGGGVAGEGGWVSQEMAELQWRQAALANALLSRMGELTEVEGSQHDADRHAAYADAAQHMLARATDLLNASCVTVFTGSTPEADAVDRADIRRVESEYASQAIALQREVVRNERRAMRASEGEDWQNGPAATDMAMLQALGGATVTVPLNTGSASSAGAGGAGVGTPAVVQSGSGDAQQTGGGDEAAKRRGFATHPGYVPSSTPK